jgi:hypothetical protein
MKRAMLLAIGLFACPAFAQTATTKATPDSENGRYTMSTVSDGVMRLDTRTGTVSICRKKADAWACEAAADDRAAYEKEIGRLQAKIASLEADRGKKDDLKLPSDADVDRAMKFFESILRRFKTMIDGIQAEDKANRT